MFNPHNRRYTGAKTKLLKNIDSALLECFDYTKYKDLSFFDVFAGTGVVSDYFLRKDSFSQFYINDFLHSNYALYQGFFSQEAFSQARLESLKQEFLALDSKKLRENYYSKHFGGKFFSLRDSKLIGEIRERIENLKSSQAINQKEFYILLSSLLYSADRVANTVGHYDAYRKKEVLKDRFIYELISPIDSKAHIEIFREDSNGLAQRFLQEKKCIDIAFIDPPYNSRQYSRFYHLLETLTLHTKPTLYGIALKPKPSHLSEYCTSRAELAFTDLLKHLSKVARVLVVTYNNTSSANARSNTRLSLESIQYILQAQGKTRIFSFSHTPFSSGKTEFQAHREYVFICECK